MSRYTTVALLLWLSLCFLPVTRAEQAFLEASCPLDYPEAMAHLQESIHHYGYHISHVQQVDKGLQQRGYQSDAYKVVFFGKSKEIDYLRQAYPVLIPFLPLSITIRQQGTQTVISTLAPNQLGQIITDFKAQLFFRRWHEEVEKILQRFATCQGNA